MNQEEYDREHCKLEVECNRRLDELHKKRHVLHQAEYDWKVQQVEEWLSRRVDRLDERFMQEAS